MQHDAGLFVRGGPAVTAGWSLDPGFVAALAGVLAVLVLVVLFAAQLFSSAAKAKDHLKRASDLAAARVVDAPVRPQFDLLASDAGTMHRRLAMAAARDDSSNQISDQLTEYYAANINQSFAIFWASLLAMVAGFVIIIIGIATAGSNPANAVVAAIAGLLSQFIAATFLVALRSTQQQSTAYAQSLAELRTRDLRAADDAQAIELGLQLLGQISGDGAAALANQTRAALAMGLIVKQLPAAEMVPQPAPAPAPVVAPTEPVADGDTAERVHAIDARSRIESVTFDQAAGEERVAER